MTDTLQHHGAAEIAAYIDGTLSPSARTALEAHLADCRGCRREIREVEQIVRGIPFKWGRVLYPIGVAAAAAVMLFMVSPTRQAVIDGDSHRDPAVTAIMAPRAIGPHGSVPVLDAIEWTSVSGADRYRVRVFDEKGVVLWQAEVADTVAARPSALQLTPGNRYFWSVRARIGWDRWVDSPLTEFGLSAGALNR